MLCEAERGEACEGPLALPECFQSNALMSSTQLERCRPQQSQCRGHTVNRDSVIVSSSRQRRRITVKSTQGLSSETMDAVSYPIKGGGKQSRVIEIHRGNCYILAPLCLSEDMIQIVMTVRNSLILNLCGKKKVTSCIGLTPLLMSRGHNSTLKGQYGFFVALIMCKMTADTNSLSWRVGIC